MSYTEAYAAAYAALFEKFIMPDGELTAYATKLGCEITQDWDNASTILAFPDGSEIRFSEGIFNISGYEAKLGAKGGAAKTEAKQAASKANGAKGGRPRKLR